MSKRANRNQGCLSALFGIFSGQKKSGLVTRYLEEDEPLADRPLPYRVRDDFLSPAEYSFYRVLRHATGDNLLICPKIRLADVFFVAQPNENRKFFNYIVAKHVDFLLCQPDSMKPVAAIELDDASHKNFDRIDRDDFVNRVFREAGLPLLRVPARRQYSTADLTALLAPYLPAALSNAAGPAPSAQPIAATLTPAPFCPKCGVQMVLRTVAAGEHKGKQFYGCRNYPQCRQVAALNEVKAGVHSAL